MPKQERSPLQSEDNQKVIASLKNLRDCLEPSSVFQVQTKAVLFQKIEEDRMHSKGASWYLMPHGFKRLAALTTAAVILTGAFFSTSLFSPSLTMAYVGEFDAVNGDVFIHRVDGTVRAKSNDKIFKGDTIEVASASTAHITFAGEAKTELAANTRIFVESIVTTNIASTVTSQVQLALQAGTLTQVRSDVTDESSATSISVVTSSGTIKAAAYADFVVSATTTDTIALSVRSEGVTVVRDVASQGGEQVVAEGQTVMLAREGTSTVLTLGTDVVTSSGSVIATIEAPRNTNSATRVTPRDPQPLVPAAVSEEVNASSSTAIVMPSKPALDLRMSQLFEAIRPRLDIAEVKLDQALSHYVNGDESAALIAMEGYISTVGDIYANIAPSAKRDEQAARAGREISPSLDVAVEKSALSKAYDGLIAMQNDVAKDSDTYLKTLQSLEILSKAEAALRIDIAQNAASEDRLIAMSSPAPETASAMLAPSEQNTNTTRISSDKSADVPAQKVDVTTYTRKVQGDIYAQVRAIVALEDGKQRSSDFVKLLGRIPNEERNIVMLERISGMVPENLRGFVAVKIHAIKYPEAK